MPDETFETALNFTTNAKMASRDIETIAANVRKLEKELAELYKSSKAEDLEKVSPMRGLIAEEQIRMARLQRIELKKQTEAERELRSVSNDRVKRQFEQIKASRPLLDEFNRRIQGKKITEIPDIQTAILIDSKKIIDAANRARREEIKSVRDASRIKIALYTREANVLRKTAQDIRENAQIIRNQASQLQGISQLALGVGTGIVGGIFGFAAKYVANAKEATTVTVAWKEAQESLGKSGEKVGAVLAEAALPLLQEAAETAQKAAAFVEKHPEIVRAALNAGLVIAGLGAVGLAVSKGIKLYADQLYLSSIPLQLEAGKLQFAAAQEQLAAARYRAGIIPGDQPVPTGPPAPTQRVPGIGNIAGALGRVVLTAGSVIIGAELGLALGNALAKLLDPNAKDMNFKETLFYGGVRAVEALEQKWFAFLGKAGDKLPDILGGKTLRLLSELGGTNIQKVDKFFQKLLLGADELGKAAEKIPGVRGSDQFEQVLKAYEDYRRDDLLLVQKHYAERESIIAGALQEELAENARYASDVKRVNANTAKSISDATRSYEEESLKAEQEYKEQRAQIVRDGGIEIQRIEEDLQERLRQLREEHEDRLGELVADRDALGIVKEQQRYSRARDEEIRQTNREIAQRRADLALRLQDLEQSHAQERAQRFADYQARLEEIRRNAAEQLTELAARHREELTQIRQQKVARIAELDKQFQEERKRRYEYFVNQIRELDASLLGEAELRKRRQNEMIVELDKFLIAYKTRMGTLLTPPASPGRASGGYASYGTYLLGDRPGGGRGKPEYVLRGDVTELAERVMGGRLSQEKMIALLNASSGNGNGNKITYNDARRMDSRISATDRERLVNDTLEALERSLR